MNKLKEIKQMPTVHDNVHESIYKSRATLQLVKDMLKRGDSNESILMVIEDVYEGHDKDEKSIQDLEVQRQLSQQWDKKFSPSLHPPFKPTCNHTTTI